MTIAKLNPADYEMRDGEQALFNKLNETIDEVNSGGGGGGGGGSLEVYTEANGDFNFTSTSLLEDAGSGATPKIQILKRDNTITITGSLKAKTTQSNASGTGAAIIENLPAGIAPSNRRFYTTCLSTWNTNSKIILYTFDSKLYMDYVFQSLNANQPFYFTITYTL